MKLIVSLLILVYGIFFSNFPLQTPTFNLKCGFSPVVMPSGFCLSENYWTPWPYPYVNFLTNIFVWSVLSVILFFVIRGCKSRRQIIFRLGLYVLIIVFVINGYLYISGGFGGKSVMVKKSYSSITDGLNSNDYQKYPAGIFKPKYISEFSGKQNFVNPLSGQSLELTTTGGGCCEMPTYTTVVDNKESIFWIEVSGGGGTFKSYQNWYGPFKIQ